MRVHAENVAAAYDARAAEYVEVVGSVEQLPASEAARIGSWRDGTSGRILDAGCGPGHWTEFLHQGGRDVRGLDLSRAFVDIARERYPHLPFVRGSLASLPWADSSLGGILAWYSVIHAPPETVPVILREFARALEPGGGLLLGFFVGEDDVAFPHAVTPAYFWSVEAMEDTVRDAGFTVIESNVRREPGRRPHGDVAAVRAG